MIGLVRHIEYLLLHNDDVFIPGLGRFTVLCDEAKIQSGGTSFLPPVRKVAFESVAMGDSGLLVRSVMRAGFISWDEAVEAIAEEVESVYKHLEQGDDYGFGRLGRLVLVDGNVCFQPQENNSIENPRFGFSPLEITPREEDAEDREIPTVEAEKVRDRVYISFHRRTVRAAAVAAAIIVFLLMLSKPINTPDTTANYAGLLSAELFGQADTTTDEAVVNDFESVLGIDEMPDTIAAGEENVLETAVHDIETARNTYYIIVASLPSKQMAEKQIECFHRQGVSADLQIYETARKSRLYVASVDDFDEARRYHSRLVQEQPLFANAWIMRAGN